MEKVKLASSEISNLWTAYLNDSAAVCASSYALQIIEDKEIRDIFDTALQISKAHLEKIKDFFNAEKYPIPLGFSVEEDVNLQAPRLYSDHFLLFYLNQMTIHGLSGYSIALATSLRADVQQYFIEGYQQASKLYRDTLNLLLSIGIYDRPPQVPTPEKARYVEANSFLTKGWAGKHRPLTAIEITSIFFNLKKSIMAKALAISFSQTAQSKEVRKFMIESRDLTQNHIETFNDILKDDFLEGTINWDSHITDSKIHPFSDKLMMNLAGFLFGAAMAYYGTGRSSSLRVDLPLHYAKVILEDEKLALKGTNILINNGWLEEPPLSINRNELID